MALKAATEFENASANVSSGTPEAVSVCGLARSRAYRSITPAAASSPGTGRVPKL
jgi:hypothetical protein